ncbi:MAG: hypothetical protein JWO41_215 [Candidatus Saccharibacteria bacterium]|nr:hypothetical protein [Candidatus Saccharibacteria bacterium]
MSSSQEGQPAPVQEQLFEATSHAHTARSDGLRDATASYTTEIIMPGDETAVEQPTAEQTLTAETTDVRLRAAHMVQSLNFLAQVSKRRGFRQAVMNDATRPELEARYGDHLDALDEEVGNNKLSLLRAAGTEFRKAYETANGPTETDDPEFRAAWSQFYRNFNGSENRRARDTRRKTLKKYVDLKGNRPLGDQYTLEDEPTVAETLEIVPALPELSKPEKLAIFEQDRRLKFPPATNREEENSRRLLNYDYKHGILELLDEIDIHTIKEWRKKGVSEAKARQYGDEARVSVLHEWGSYLGNAKQQYQVLTDLHIQLDGVNPNLTLVNALDGVLHRGLAALVRDKDYKHFLYFGKEKLGFDPLLTREDRRPQANLVRNKTVEDRYTVENPEEMIQKRIEEWASRTTVGELRTGKDLEYGIVGQRNRIIFWNKVLKATEGADKRIANEIREELGFAD